MHMFGLGPWVRLSSTTFVVLDAHHAEDLDPYLVLMNAAVAL